MNEEAPVVVAEQQPAPVEAAPVEQQAAPVETAATTFADLDAEFNLTEEYAPQQQQQQPDIYGKLTELEQRLAQIVPPAAQEEDLDTEPQERVDVNKIEQRVLEKLTQQQAERIRHEQVIQQAIVDSKAIKADYETKFMANLEKQGVNLDSNPLVKEFLAESLTTEIQKEQLTRGRAVLTGAEMKQVVARHLQKVKPYVGQLMPNATKAQTTQSLSSAANSQTTPTVDKKSAYDNFKQKKEQGTLSMKDILKAL